MYLPDFQPQRKIEDQLLQVILRPSSLYVQQEDCGPGSGTRIAACTKNLLLPGQICWHGISSSCPELGAGLQGFHPEEKQRQRVLCHSRSTEDQSITAFSLTCMLKENWKPMCSAAVLPITPTYFPDTSVSQGQMYWDEYTEETGWDLQSYLA